MGDSLFYTDEMLEELEKSSSENNVREIETFLQKCKNVNNNIITLSKKLNKSGIGQLNINDDLKSIVETIKKMKEDKNKLILSDEEKERINVIFDKLKKDVVALINKHIAKYNNKVGYINVRVKKLVNEWKKIVLSEDVQEIIAKLSVVEECKIFNDGDWRQLNYLDALDYNKLEEQYKYISSIEKKLKIKAIESVEIWSSCNYVETTIIELKAKIKEDMTISEIDSLINRCYSSYEELVDLDIRHELTRTEKSDKRVVAGYNGKIAGLVIELDDVIKDLLKRKKMVTKKLNSYKDIAFDLEQLENKYQVIMRKIVEYRGECNKNVVTRLNSSYLNQYQKELDEIEKRIRLEKESLDAIQYSNLIRRVKKLNKKFDDINFDLNVTPFMLDGVDVALDFNNKMKEFDVKLLQLTERIDDLGGRKSEYIKDHSVRKEIDRIISDRWKELDNYDKLLKHYKKNFPEMYNSLKSKLDERKSEFDKTCKIYRGKCPLLVKQVKSAKHLYKKHKKEILIVAGLSVTVLLLKHAVIIPAIMHGNIMIANTTPLLRPFAKISNRILGGIIGATRSSTGIWTLANGKIINPAVGTSSLLKGLATITGARIAVPAIAGVAFGIKGLVSKIKKKEMKSNVKKSANNVDDYFKKLFKDYINSKELLDVYAINKGLTEEEVMVLKVYEQRYKENNNADVLVKKTGRKKGGK